MILFFLVYKIASMNSIKLVSTTATSKSNNILKELNEKYMIISLTYNIKFSKKSLRKHVLELFKTIDEGNNIESIKYFRMNLISVFNFYVRENENEFRLDSMSEYVIDNYVLKKYQKIYENACKSINEKDSDFSEYQKYIFLFNLTLCLLCGKNCRYIKSDINYTKEFSDIINNHMYIICLEESIEKLASGKSIAKESDNYNKLYTYIFILSSMIIMIIFG